MTIELNMVKRDSQGNELGRAEIASLDGQDISRFYGKHRNYKPIEDNAQHVEQFRKLFVKETSI